MTSCPGQTYACPNMTKCQVHHFFMSSYIFINQVSYIYVIYLYQIPSVSRWFCYFKRSLIREINPCLIHKAVNFLTSSCVHIFIYHERGNENLIRSCSCGRFRGKFGSRSYNNSVYIIKLKDFGFNVYVLMLFRLVEIVPGLYAWFFNYYI